MPEQDLSEQAARVDAKRLERLIEINADPSSREALEAKYGKVWNAEELRQDFEVVGFAAPFIVVTRKSDNEKGSLEFQHHPRFYFNFDLHNK